MARKLTRSITSAAAVLALTASIFTISTPTAQAAPTRNGVCEPGEVCFYYHKNQRGSVSDFTTSIPNYGTKRSTCYVFRGPGNGKGKCMKNDAASVTNRTNKPVTVFFHSNYRGASQTIPAGASVNLNSKLKNDNASHRIGDGANDQPPPIKGSLKNPYPPEYGRNGGYTRRTTWLKERISQEFPTLTCNTYVSSSKHSSHSTGNALDCFGKLSERRRLANWLKENAHPLEVWYVIHEQKIYSLAKPQSGWRPMKDRGNPTANHYDHVHVSLQDPKHEF